MNAEFYLQDLESKFKKINPEDYYLSYSGGRDSHFLYWFIKEYAHIDGIEIVSVNTFMEHPQILKRMRENADTILYPKMKPFEIKEKYGIPCFSKSQDYAIHLYQNGNRNPPIVRQVTRRNPDGSEYISSYRLNKTASQLVVNGELHKVSPYCCIKLKKAPASKFRKQSGKKPILAVRQSEGILRKAHYTSCFKQDGTFTPIHDLDDETLRTIEQKYDIEVPEIYNHISRTGCMGCPYGHRNHNTEKELALITPAQRKFVGEYFKETYEVLGVPIEQIKIQCGDYLTSGYGYDWQDDPTRYTKEANN